MTASLRDQVFDALLARLVANVPGLAQPQDIKKYSRRMTLPANIPPGDLPCLMSWEQDETTQNPGFATPAKRIWETWVTVVLRNPDKDVPGATLLNPIIEQIEAAVQDANSDNLNLGGLVYWVKIQGDTVKNTGDTDPNGLGGFIIPVQICVP